MENDNTPGDHNVKFTYQEQRPQELVPHGSEVEAEVKAATFGISKGGNDMLVLDLVIYNGEGQAMRNMKDYLTFTEASSWKVSTVMKATGLAPADGEEMVLDESILVGKRAWVKVLVEDWTNMEGETKPTNKIAAWLPGAPSVTA